VSEPRQRQKSAQVSTTEKPSQEVKRPEVEEDALEEEGEEEREEEEEKDSEKAILTEPAEPNHSDHDDNDAYDFSRSLHDVLSLLMVRTSSHPLLVSSSSLPPPLLLLSARQGHAKRAPSTERDPRVGDRRALRPRPH
jgi:hypothetical protein